MSWMDAKNKVGGLVVGDVVMIKSDQLLNDSHDRTQMTISRVSNDTIETVWSVGHEMVCWTFNPFALLVHVMEEMPNQDNSLQELGSYQ